MHTANVPQIRTRRPGTRASEPDTSRVSQQSSTCNRHPLSIPSPCNATSLVLMHSTDALLQGDAITCTHAHHRCTLTDLPSSSACHHQWYDEGL